MSEPRPKFRPYTLNVAPDPRDEGGWLWAIHSNGKLIQKSRRKLISEAQAKRDAQGAMEMLLEDRTPD
ncbi:hypothetical protein [Methylobacterium nigriterrae]|uniref:hypothetical protein n=1 Tax=Methylobacterium nigriterrae TaxID=3127512 RepID=UPI003013BFB9